MGIRQLELTMNYYQYFPFLLNPVAISIGPINITWYALMYLVGFLSVYVLLLYRLKKDRTYMPIDLVQRVDSTFIQNFLFYAFFGLIIGARIGYVLFYNLDYYLDDLWRIISPFDPVSGKFRGIYGMSYHGGLIGVIIASWVFTKKNNIDWLKLADFIAPVIPAGYFFGRLGNFINSELYGRATEKFWGMYFPTDSLGLLRHPSQLYEALLEGAVLFFLLWFLRNNEKYSGRLLIIYMAGYAVLRFIVEFFREPSDPKSVIIGTFTIGQILSLIMFLGAIFVYWRNKKYVIE